MIKQSLQLLTAAVLINAVNFNTSYCMENNIIIHKNMDTKQLYNEFNTIFNGITEIEKDNFVLCNSNELAHYASGMKNSYDSIQEINKKMLDSKITTKYYKKVLEEKNKRNTTILEEDTTVWFLCIIH